jgi:hypothetical protein
MAEQQSTVAEKIEAAGFIRRCVVRKPDTTLEEILVLWEKDKHVTGKKPTEQQLHSVRYQIKQKYGIADLSELPIKAGGDVNITGLIRLLLKKHPTMTEKQCGHYMRQDGFEYTPALFRTTQQQMNAGSASNGSPDENQGKGPRARVKRRGRLPKEKKDKLGLTPTARKTGEQYVEMENLMDDLVQQARTIEDSELVEMLRNARRHVIRKTFALFPVSRWNRLTISLHRRVRV